MHPHALLFDLDGTLVDSAAGICASCRAACVALGYPEPVDDAIRPFIGLPVTELLRAVVPAEWSIETIDRWIDRYRAEFDRIALPTTVAFGGVPEEIARWHRSGRRLAITTSKRTDRALAVLRQAELLDFFDAVVGGEQTPRGKPHPDIALRALDLLGCRPSEAALVGDTAHDIGMARAAGVDAYAVSYGVHDRDVLALAGPRAIVDRFGDLRTYLG